MPAVPSTLAQMQSMFGSLFYNPAGRFVTPVDVLNYIQGGAADTANEVGGIRVIDQTTITLAGQSVYTLDNAVRKIMEIRYIQSPANSGQANGAWVELDMITMRDNAFLNMISTPFQQQNNPYGLVLQGTPQPVPKYGIFLPTLNQLTLLDPPVNAGDTVWLDCLEVPNNLTGSIVYNGDALEMQTIVNKAVGMAWLKRGESQMSQVFDVKWQKGCEGIRRMRSKMRQRRQAGDGRFTTTKLKSVNGAV